MSRRPWLVLDCYVEGPEGGAPNFLPYLTDRTVQTVRTVRDPLPDSPADSGGLVITGSAAGVNDGLPWVTALVDFTRQAVRAGVPVLGVCFGHQVLAEAAAGPGAVRRAVQPEVGWFEIQCTPAASLAGFPPRFVTFLSHHDEVDPEAAASLQVLARSARCPVQAFSVPGTLAWGVQFHAEMSTQEALALAHRRGGGNPLGQVVDSRPLISQLMRSYVAAVRAAEATSLR